MRAALCLLFLACLAVDSSPQSLTAASILRDSENRVNMLDRQVDSTNGTFTVSVRFNSDILGKKATGDARYAITVRDGMDNKNILVSADSFTNSAVASMVESEIRRRVNKPIMDLYRDNAFPWTRFLARANRKHEFAARVDSDSAFVAGKRCFVVSFTLKAEGDSVSAEGEGKVWIDAKTLLPVRTYRDFDMRTMRGRAEVKSYSDFTCLDNGIPVMLRSETEAIPKFLLIGVGSIKTVVEQSDFNLE